MGFAPINKRFGLNFDRLPAPVKIFFNNLQKRGQIPAVQRNLREVPLQKQYKTFEQWKYLPGDKVMIVKGPFKGTVTKIAARQDSTNGFFLEEGPINKIVIPKEYWRQSQDSHVVDYPLAVTRDYFKLVGSLTNEETGKVETFAANDVVFRGKYWDENHKKMLPYRCVKNQEHITIPWPAPAPIQDDLLCTPESKVLERTYFPTSIVHSGMPADLKSSLRSPLAKRRVPRYAKQYVSRSDIKRLTAPEMPEPEHRKLMRLEKQSLAERAIKFTPDMEEFIGKKVADHLNKITNPHMKAYIERVSGDKEKKE